MLFVEQSKTCHLRVVSEDGIMQNQSRSKSEKNGSDINFKNEIYPGLLPLRVVQPQTILFLKSMSERGESDTERL